MRTRIAPSAFFALIAVTLAACAAERPIMYPNAKFNEVGPAVAQSEVDQCMQMAASSGVKTREHTPDTGEVAVNTGAGAASGAARGAIYGNAGSGAAAGAAGAATNSIFRGIFRPHTSPTHRRFVELCLRERGYQVTGWQ